jgi:hypothetical protein
MDTEHMKAALRITTTVLPGSKIEITDPGLVVGEPVDVIVVTHSRVRRKKRTVMDIIESGRLPRRTTSPEDVDRRIQEERSSWDR